MHIFPKILDPHLVGRDEVKDQIQVFMKVKCYDIVIPSEYM